ncbi:MAG: hypothetical protein PHF00_12825, partial [Elusimicrobia bacterium]|nr:hypothetical protein [Elusimicrobiota bacterium]
MPGSISDSPRRVLAILLSAALVAVSPGLPCYAALAATAKTAAATAGSAGHASVGAARLGALPAVISPAAGPAAPGLRTGFSAPEGVLEAAQTSVLISPAPAALSASLPAAQAAPLPAQLAAPQVAGEAAQAVSNLAAGLQEQAAAKARTGQVTGLRGALNKFYDNGAGLADGAGPVAAVSGRSGNGADLMAPERTASAAPASPPSASDSVRAAGRTGLKAYSMIIAGLNAAATLGLGALFSAAGLPLAAGLAAPLAVGLAYRLGRPYVEDTVLGDWRRQIRGLGGAALTREAQPELFAEVAELARLAGVDIPELYLAPVPNALTGSMPGGRKVLLALSEGVLYSPYRRAILAHELQHVADFRSSLSNFPYFVKVVAIALGAIVLGGAGLDLLTSGLATAAAHAWTYAWAAASAGLGLAGSRVFAKVHALLMDLKADQGVLAFTGDANGLRSILEFYLHTQSRLRAFLARAFSGRIGRLLGASFARFAAPPTPAAEPPVKEPADTASGNLKITEELARSREQLAQLEQLAREDPLARWMLRFFMQLKAKRVFTSENPVTVQDIVNWDKWVRKFEGKRGWPLRAAVERGARIIFRNSLPLDLYEGRDLRLIFDEMLEKSLEELDKPSVPPSSEELANAMQTPWTGAHGPDPAAAASVPGRFEGASGKKSRSVPADSVKLVNAMQTPGTGANGPGSAAEPPVDYADPATYKKVPDWAKELTESAAGDFKSPEDFARYKEQLAQLGPLARWMVHFYAQLKEKGVFMAPNLLTIQDIVNWGKYVLKMKLKNGWPLATTFADDGKKKMGAVELGARVMLRNGLPLEPYENRDLRGIFDETLKESLEVLDKLAVPEHIPGRAETPSYPDQDRPAPADAVEFVNEEPVLLETQETEDNGERMDFILTPAVRERLDDLTTLYSLDYKDKFFPLLIGDTGEGKSTLVKYMFSEVLRANPHLGG